MSRRFGRNQKRRMRAELVEKQERVGHLERGLELSSALARDQSDKISDLKYLLAEFADRVGRYAIAEGIPIKYQADNLDLSYQKRFQMTAKKPMPATFGNASMPTIASICAEVMSVLDLEVVLEHVTRDMHCRLYFDNHRIGYALSHHALRGLSRDELVRRIAPEIAYFLEAELKRVGMR